MATARNRVRPGGARVAKPRPEDCAAILRALGDATRLRVLQALLRGPAHVGELVELLAVEQSLLSHHLKVMRDAGLVTARRDGKAVLYRVAPEIEGADPSRSIDLRCCQVVFELGTTKGP